MRIKSFACGVAAVAWASFLVTATVRFDPSGLAQWRDRLISGEGPRISLTERLEAATDAILEVSRRMLLPAVIVADSSGTIDDALPLSVKVTKFVPYTEVILTGLPLGTTLTSGTSAGAREWRINIADLANAQVIPPHGYSGLMTLVAELRDAEGHPLSRTPVRLTWSAGAEPPLQSDANEIAAREMPADTLASAGEPQDQQLLVASVGGQNEDVVLPKPKPLKRTSVATKNSKAKKQMAMAHKHRMQRRDLRPDAEARWASGQLPPYSLVADPRSERQAQLDRIFRDLFVAGKQADNCSLAGRKQVGQKQTRDNCSGAR
jgi:hypothetical protein